jgi:thymidylate synthase ThyX
LFTSSQADAPSSDVDAAKAARLFDRVFTEYGDDSVAQLGGVHLACEQVSNIFTKVLERGRLAAYLEQSTRYIYYDQKIDGRYQYYVPPELARAGLVEPFTQFMDELFDAYGHVVRAAQEWLVRTHPLPAGESERVWNGAIKAKACDIARPLLPGATTSNVGIYANGQAYEQLLLRLMASPLQEAQWYGGAMLEELRRVIPSFLRRVDLPDKGLAAVEYLQGVDKAMPGFASRDDDRSVAAGPTVTLLEWDPDAETKTVAAALFSYDSRSMTELLEYARGLSRAERAQILRAYIGERSNRRHRPGRAFEIPYYVFEINADYGAFRDLQRHRLLTIEWQQIGVDLGYYTPDEIREIGFGDRWMHLMDGAADMYRRVRRALGPAAAQYVVPFGYNVRFYWKLNAREAFHLVELRTGAGGHPTYRKICQDMHRLIKEQAGHTVIADGMSFVDYQDSALGRLEGERRAERKRAAAS